MYCTSKLSWTRGCAMGALVAVAALGFGPQPAHAEGPATPDGKGIAGGILLGAELVMITEAIIGVEDVWPYPVFGAVGAGAGAVGGWGVEQTGSAEAALYMLAGGMALVVPTLVAVLNVTAYDPESDSFDEGVTPEGEGEATDGDKPEASPPAVDVDAEAGASTGARRRVPPALVGVDSRGVLPGVPAVEFRPLYAPEELAKYGVEQGTEVRFPIVHATF